MDDKLPQYTPGKLRICVYADEVQTLANMKTMQDASANSNRSLLSAFTSAWACLGSSQPIFLVLLLADLQSYKLTIPPTLPKLKWSANVHQAPYTELPLDVPNPSTGCQPLFCRGKLTVNEVATVSFFANLGRPLCVIFGHPSSCFSGDQ